MSEQSGPGLEAAQPCFNGREDGCPQPRRGLRNGQQRARAPGSLCRHLGPGGVLQGLTSSAVTSSPKGTSRDDPGGPLPAPFGPLPPFPGLALLDPPTYQAATSIRGQSHRLTAATYDIPARVADRKPRRRSILFRRPFHSRLLRYRVLELGWRIGGSTSLNVPRSAIPPEDLIHAGRVARPAGRDRRVVDDRWHAGGPCPENRRPARVRLDCSPGQPPFFGTRGRHPGPERSGGRRALGVLQQAVHQSDAEVRRRAEALVRQIDSPPGVRKTARAEAGPPHLQEQAHPGSGGRLCQEHRL